MPESFDAREKWPNCLHPIRDQSKCGSCWAFSGSEILSDRFCIASEGKINVVLSPQYIVSCDGGNGGCKGGLERKLWQFLIDQGSTLDSCVPYVSGHFDVPNCTTYSFCKDGSPLIFYKAKASYSFKNMESVKAEIMANGPVQAAFKVYRDFMNYKGGIYVQESQEYVDNHVIKIIGWGVEEGVEFWIAANSWGTQWGEDGFFRIKSGECGINEYIMTGTPDLQSIKGFYK